MRCMCFRGGVKIHTHTHRRSCCQNGRMDADQYRERPAVGLSSPPMLSCGVISVYVCASVSGLTYLPLFLLCCLSDSVACFFFFTLCFGIEEEKNY
jgi:hypothetical protein